jgi:hypothetical protein
MSKIESAEEFAETMKACASEFLGGDEWDQPFAIACVQARDRAVAKKVLEGLAGHVRGTDWYYIQTLANNPAELDRLLKE